MKNFIKCVLAASILSVSISNQVIGMEADKKDMHTGMAMSHENMEKMHNNMLVMEEQILAVKQESDPKKQQKIMHKHRKSMLKMIQIMHRNMGNMPLTQQIKMAEHHLEMIKGIMPKMSSTQ
tara:strand:- start:158 stop:523 length:366 start_codon:yes stop_codon:yes gene_type:complete